MNDSNHALPGTVPDELSQLDSHAIALHTSTAGTLVLTLDGQIHNDIRPSLAYPLTNPTHFVFLIDSDDKTLGYIDAMDKLSEASRKALEQELHFHYYTTQIKSITDASSRHGITSWDVITEQGSHTIHVKDRGDIRHLHSGSVIFTDAHGMKFVIPDRHKLDPASLAHLEAES